MAAATAEAVAAVHRPQRISKMHGAGNDFVVIDLRDGAPPPGADATRALADRHTGVGCDQLLTIEAPRSADAVASYRIWNADGSPATQCGNGARCVAAWLVRDGSAQGPAFVLDSPSGSHRVERVDEAVYRIAMGRPRFAPAQVPLLGFQAVQDVYVLQVDGRDCAFGAVSMGNPHALVEVDDIARAPVATLGPALQAHAAFPESVNVGFAQVLSRGRIALRVHERGAGETLACGSGACAAAVVLMRRGRIDREVIVALPGGELRIGWPDAETPVSMAGPATFVFDGVYHP
ncbi:MAG: diaminopimelate epimerase [Luteimonas sp.]